MNEHAGKEGIALRTANESDRIALRGVRVQSRLVALGQKTTIEQTFVNLEDRAIEAVYTFPLPEGAAVCHFEAMTGDRVLTGQVEDTEQAEKEYDDHISKGDGAFLLEQHQPDVFTINVGNLKPKQAVTIRITYVAELTVHDSTIRLAFPTTVAPRYVTATGMDPLEAIREGEKINPPHVLTVPYGMSLEVIVELGLPVRAVESSSHHILTNAEGSDSVRVTLAAGLTEMDRDVVLTITLKEEPVPVAQAGTGPGGGTFIAVTFQPHFDDLVPHAAQPTEVFFVLDCSGSMAGDSITHAATALELCLRTLNDGDTFNICRFGSTFEFMSPQMLIYSQATLGRAVEYVRRVQADLGGTEMFAPLEAIFRIPSKNGTQRQIILLTDGEIGNENAVIALADRHKEQNRIFTFGIGYSCSTHLVEGLARATCGVAEYMSRGERIEEKVLRMFSRLSSPTITDLQVDWGGVEVLEACPDRPAIFEGDSLSIMGRVTGASPKVCRIKVATTLGAAEWDVPVPSPHTEHDMIATLWGRRRIRYLERTHEEQVSASPRQYTESTMGIGRFHRRVRRKIVDTSREFGLLSSATSFIAVEHRSLEERNDGHPAFRRVPVQLARGWGGVIMACFVDHDERADYYMMDPSDLCQSIKAKSPGPRSVSRVNITIRDDAVLRAPADPLFEILQAQQADGRFEWNDTLDNELRRLGLTHNQCREVVERWLERLAAEHDKAERPAVVDTLVVLFVLRRKYLDRKELWSMAQDKAIAYVQAKTGIEEGVIDEQLAVLESMAQPAPHAASD